MTATDLPLRLASAFERADIAALVSLYADDATFHHPFFPEGLRGREAIAAAEGPLFEAFSDIRYTIHKVVEEPGRLAIEWSVQATHTAPMPLPDGSSLPTTGITIAQPGCEVLYLDADGLIAEDFRYQDAVGMLAQLGLA